MTIVAGTEKREVSSDVQIKQMFELSRKSVSESTRRLRRTAWDAFIAFCKGRNIVPYKNTEMAVALFITHMHAEGRSPNTIWAYSSCLRRVFEERGLTVDMGHPNIRKLLSATRREGRPPKGKDPLRTEHVVAMLRATDNTPAGLQERALLLLIYAGACRRSEIVALDVEDLSFAPEGLTIHIRKSKTDQEGHGRRVDIAYAERVDRCPIRAVRQLLNSRGYTSGPIFRSGRRGGHLGDTRLSGQSVARIIKRLAKRAGLEGDFSGHSPRAGHITEAVRANVGEAIIVRQTGHMSLNSLRPYIRLKREFKSNSSRSLGL